MRSRKGIKRKLFFPVLSLEKNIFGKLIPISFKNDKSEETTLFDAEKGGFPQTPIRKKAKIH